LLSIQISDACSVGPNIYLPIGLDLFPRLCNRLDLNAAFLVVIFDGLDFGVISNITKTNRRRQESIEGSDDGGDG